MKTLSRYAKDLVHLVFPHYCEGCGSDVIENEQLLCLKCQCSLPETGFFEAAGNPVEKIFYGRLAVENAGAGYYYTKDSLMQHLVFQLKYHGNSNVGKKLGSIIGSMLQNNPRFNTVDAIVPLPLNEKKLRKRGYNQAALITEGMAAVMNKPHLVSAVERKVFTESQTRKDRIARWQTMQEVFLVKDLPALEGKHILLVDDIITTGATLEACGSEMLKVPGLKLSIATVAYTI